MFDVSVCNVPTQQNIYRTSETDQNQNWFEIFASSLKWRITVRNQRTKFVCIGSGSSRVNGSVDPEGGEDPFPSSFMLMLHSGQIVNYPTDNKSR